MMENVAPEDGVEMLEHDISSGAVSKGDRSKGEVSKADLKASGGAGKAVRIACSFWLEKKKRFCTNQSKPGHRFCGNHVPEEALGFKRVPCPVDPSHTVPEFEVAAHVLRCPAAKQAQGVREQPYFREGVNAGSDAENGSHDGAGGVLTSREKRALLEGLSESEFWGFLEKIETAYASTCPEPLVRRVAQPEGFRRWLEGGKDSSSPFSAKHWEQQASILGNMDRAGLIDRPRPGDAERAATKGTTSSGPPTETRADLRIEEDLAEPVLEEERANGLLREAGSGREAVINSPDTLHRNTPTREDGSSSNGVPDGLAGTDASTVNKPPGRVFIEFGAGRGYLANALYECFGQPDVLFVERRAYKFKADRALRKVGKMERIRIDIEDLDLAGVESLRGRGFVGAGKHLCGPATDATLRCCLGSGDGNGNGPGDGIGKERTGRSGGDETASKGRGESGNETKSVGKGARANGLSADVSNDATGEKRATSIPTSGPDLRSEVDASREAPFCSGVAVATCCHHLCSWRTYVNKAFFRRLGFSPADFHMLTWLTSWCVSGPKFGEHRGPDAGNIDELSSPVGRSVDGSDRLKGNGASSMSMGEGSRTQTNEKSDLGSKTARKEGSLASDNARESSEVNGASNGSVTLQPPIWDALLPSQRAELGKKCKRLIDTGRLEWLAEQEGFAAELIEYIDAEVSPENRLLVATRTRNVL